MKNIYLIPTDKPTMLAYYQEGTSYKESKLQVVKHTSSDYKYQYVYITSDEKIKGDDWGLSLGVEGGNLLFKAKNIEYHSTCKKIVLTNDPKLIGDGVQDINGEFLEWFCNNSSCEEVEVETYLVRSRFIWRTDYRIIIPKEEPKQVWEQIIETCGGKEEFMESAGLLPKQETLEEVAHKMLDDYGIKSIGQSIGVLEVKKLMVKMAKWQQEQDKNNEKELYSEIEYLIINWSNDETKTAGALTRQIIEQFKKK